MTHKHTVTVVPSARSLGSPFQEVIEAIDRGENPMEWPESRRIELGVKLSLEWMGTSVGLWGRCWRYDDVYGARTKVFNVTSKIVFIARVEFGDLVQCFARGFERHPTNTPMRPIDRGTLSNDQCRDQHPHDWITRDEVKLCDRCEYVWLDDEQLIESEQPSISCIGCKSFWERRSSCTAMAEGNEPGRYVVISEDARDPIPTWCPGRRPQSTD